MSEWISIKDKRPPDGVLKLFCNVDCKEVRNLMYVGWFAGGVEVAQTADRKATHWMDLPDLPKEQS